MTTNRNTEDLADALSMLIKDVGDRTIDTFEGKDPEPFDSKSHTARICRIVERIEDAAFKRGAEAQLAEHRRKLLGVAREGLRSLGGWCEIHQDSNRHCPCNQIGYKRQGA